MQFLLSGLDGVLHILPRQVQDPRKIKEIFTPTHMDILDIIPPLL